MTALEFTYTVGAELTAAGIASLIAKTKGKITFRFPTWREVITTTMLSALLISYIFSRGSLGWLSLSILVAAFLFPIIQRLSLSLSLSQQLLDLPTSPKHLVYMYFDRIQSARVKKLFTRMETCKTKDFAPRRKKRKRMASITCLMFDITLLTRAIQVKRSLI